MGFVNRIESWHKVTVLLCCFGVLREIRPSEPFVSEFLSGEWRNITEAQLNQEIYPVGTYSYLALLVVVFLFTDYLRFKPVIIISGLSGIGVYVILLWTISLQWLQVSQFVYGVFMATEVAYYTYIFAKVERDKYPQVSSYTRIAALTGRFLSGISAQLFVMFELLDYRELNYVTLVAQILATCWAFFLPPVLYSVYFHRVSISENAEECVSQQMNGALSAASLIANHAVTAYRRKTVIAWSLFYALTLCLFVQTQYYMQLLWIAIERDNGHNGDITRYNGFVEAILTFLGALGAYLTSFYRPTFLPGLLSLVQAAALFLSTYSGMVLYSYIGYVVVGFCYHYLITQASTKIAGQLGDESCFGLIFGINTLIGTALQALLTFLITSPRSFNLDIYQQYYVISGCYATLAVIWNIVYFTARLASYYNRREE